MFARPRTVGLGVLTQEADPRYAYGPLGTLYTVTDSGRAATRTTRDAFGRVRQLDDPDRGTTLTYPLKSHQ